MKKVFKNLKIGQKLSRTFLIIVACFILSAAVSIVGAILIISEMSYFHSKPFLNVATARTATRNMQSSVRNALNAIVETDEAATKEYIDASTKDHDALLENLDFL
jgi:CHASE3 domain sensor protein